MLVYHEREFRQVGYWILDVYLCNCSRVYAFPGWYKELQAPQDIWKPINTYSSGTRSIGKGRFMHRQMQGCSLKQREVSVCFRKVGRYSTATG